MKTKNHSALRQLFLLQASSFVVLFFLLSGCKGMGEQCSVDHFGGFNTDSLNTPHFRFFDEQFVHTLKPGITYLFNDSTQVSYATGTDFTVLCFQAFSDDAASLKALQFGNTESKIALRVCYSTCSYRGRTLKFRRNNPKTAKALLLNTMSAGMSRKIQTDTCVYLEGRMKNLGLYFGKQEFIFMPYDRYIFAQKDAFYAKVLLIKDGNELLTYIFYSNKKIQTDITDFLPVNLLPDKQKVAW